MDKEKIINHFGLKFYEKLICDLETYKEIWGLYDFEQIDYYSVNCIFKCISNKYGPCVLKIGKSGEDAENEYQILNEYNGRNFCKIYESDIGNGVLLIERLIPGVRLRDEADIDKRLDLFYGLFSKLHIEAVDKSVYPTYLGWVSRITDYMRNRSDYKMLYEKMLKAEDICRNLCLKYPGEMLLHGDLHHDNILSDCNGSYRAVDPKGVIGDIVFDIPRFILNEFNDVIDNNFQNKFIHITKTLSKKIQIPEKDIRCLTYVEMCIGNCWSVESEESPNIDDVLFTEKMMYEIM